MDMLLPPALNYSSCFSPTPFPIAISPQSCTADHCKNLILKFTQTPNMLGTVVFLVVLQQNHFMHNNKLCTVHTKKYEIYNDTVRCTYLSQENNTHTSQHQYIYYRKLLLKIGFHSPETPKAGCNLHNTPFWQQNHFL